MTALRARRPGEVVFALVMLLLSAFLLWAAVDISGVKSYTSAGAYPMAAAATMLACSLIVLVQTLRLPDDADDGGAPAWRRFVRRIAPPVIVSSSAVIGLYMLALERLGFVVASYLFLVVMMRLLGGTRWGVNLTVSAVVLGAIYLVFQTIFSVVLPTGTLWRSLLP